MEIVIQCPNVECEEGLAVEDTAAGSQIKCPKCNTLMVVPVVRAGETRQTAPQSLAGASDDQLAEKPPYHRPQGE